MNLFLVNCDTSVVNLTFSFRRGRVEGPRFPNNGRQQRSRYYDKSAPTDKRSAPGQAKRPREGQLCSNITQLIAIVTQCCKSIICFWPLVICRPATLWSRTRYSIFDSFVTGVRERVRVYRVFKKFLRKDMQAGKLEVLQ